MATHVKRRPPALSFSETYHAAQSFLAHIGSAPHRLEEPANGIVEFFGDGYHGRLRYDDAPLTQAALLALLKSTEGEEGSTILFSASGFTGSAEVFGENLQVALFSVTPAGDRIPRSPAAHQMMPSERFEPPFASAVDDDADDPPGAWLPGQTAAIADHEWLDCQVCGTTHHPEANFCHRCGANLARRNRVVPTAKTRASLQSSTTPPPLEVRTRAAATREAADADQDHAGHMRCRSCGSHDIEVLRD